MLVELQELPTRELYRLLWAYYQNNGLYETLADEVSRVSSASAKDLRAIRNPANRVVEFYATKIWPGELDKALVIETDNDSIIDPLQQVWTWSNWASRKQRFIRWFATLGEGFIKTVSTADQKRVYHQVLDPTWVTDFDTDERGYLTWLRLDYAAERRKEDGSKETYTHTEVWDKAIQAAQYWDHKKALGTNLKQLGDPSEVWEFSQAQIDFIPIVYAPFRDIGGDNERGNGAFTYALDKIDEANRLASMLHARLFRYGKPDKALVGVGSDASGRPLPPPILQKDDGTKIDSNTYDMGDEKLYRLPSGWTIENLIPNLPWDSALAILNAHLAELEHDLPELVYWRIGESSDLSGKAIRMMLTGAIDRAVEVRGNAEAILQRADEMALTIGQNLGVFSGLGAYENGDFQHRFVQQPIIPLTEEEIATTMELYVRATVPVHIAAQWAGKTEEAIEELTQATEEERKRQEESLQNAMNNVQTNLAKGGNTPEDANQTQDKQPAKE